MKYSISDFPTTRDEVIEAMREFNKQYGSWGHQPNIVFVPYEMEQEMRLWDVDILGQPSSIWKPEIIVGGDFIYVTGLLHAGNETYRLFKVDVSIRKPRVTFCSWCPDPHHPSPEHHPRGQVRHDFKKEKK